jgi:hypothetical protein
LPTSTNGEVIFEVTDDFIKDNHLEWGQYVGTSIDGATAMNNAKKGVVVYIQAIAPEAKPTQLLYKQRITHYLRHTYRSTASA